MKGRQDSNRGFMLIEVIVMLVIAAIFGVIVYQYLGSSLFRSSAPIFRLQKSFALRLVIENISADYKKNYKQDLPGLQTKIGNDGAIQNFYCGAENDCTSYTVVDNKLITFDASKKETETGGDMLKVTIKNDQKETITVLFISP